MSVSGDQTLNEIWVVFGAVSHICIQWSMILALVYSCEVARASTDLTETASASVLVK